MGVAVVAPLKGIPTFTNYTVGTAIVQLTKVNTQRKSLVIQNNGGGTVYLGSSTVAASGANSGYQLAAGATFTDNSTNTDWWSISATGSNVLLVMEVT